MATPVDEKLIELLYRKYNLPEPTDAQIDGLNDKYGNDNNAFAKDFLMEHDQENAQSSAWLDKKLKKVNSLFPTQDIEEEEVKKKEEEITVSGGPEEETITTSDIEPPTEETPVVDISVSEEEPKEEPPHYKAIVENPNYDATSTEDQGVPRFVTTHEQINLAPSTDLGKNTNLGYNTTGDITYTDDELFDMSQQYEAPSSDETYTLSQTQPEQAPGIIEKKSNLAEEEKRQVLIGKTTIVGGRDLQQAAFYNGIITGGYQAPLTAEASPEVSDILSQGGLAGLVDNPQDLDNIDDIQDALRNKGYSDFQIGTLIDEAVLKSVDRMDDNITEVGNTYHTDDEKDVSNTFTAFQVARRNLFNATTNIDAYEVLGEEDQNNVNALYQEEHGKSYKDYWEAQAQSYENELTFQALAYSHATSKEGTQLYSPITNTIINKKDATKEDIMFDDNLTEAAKEFNERQNSDIDKLIDARRDAYFELLFIADKLRDHHAESVASVGAVDLVWGDILNTGALEFSIFDVDISKGMASGLTLRDSEKETFTALQTGRPELYKDNQKQSAGSLNEEDFYFDGRLNLHKVSNPLANVYNEKLSNFLIIDRALVLNKNAILEAEANPESLTDYFKRGFYEGAGQVVPKGAKEEARDFIYFMKENTGIEFTEEMTKKVEDTFLEETVHEGGAIAPIFNRTSRYYWRLKCG